MKKNFFLLIIFFFLFIFFSYNCSIPSDDDGVNNNDPPYVVNIIPADGATGIDYNFHSFKITFSKPMKDAVSFNYNFTGADYRLRWLENNTILYIVFQEALASNATCSITLNPDGHPLNFESQDGIKLAKDTGPFSFETGGITNQPSMISSYPLDGATGVDRNLNFGYVEIIFSEDMEDNFCSLNFKDSSSNNVDIAMISWEDPRTFRVYPEAVELPLLSNETYTIELNPLGSGQWFRSWPSNVRLHESTTFSFTTGL